MEPRRARLARADRIERACYSLGTALIISGLVHLCVLLVTGDTWRGPISWRKPMTFGLSFGLTLTTITWVSSYVRLADRTRTWLLSAFAAASVLEVSLITLQAWRRVPSHFNLSTTFDGVVARVLAAGGGVLIAVIALLTVASFRTGPAGAEAGARVPPAMRSAVRAGLVIFDVGLLLGAAMIAIGIARVIGGDQQGGYVVGGALKLAHGVALHAVLVLPLLAWLLARTAGPGRSEEQQLRLVRLATAGYALLCTAAVVWSVVGLLRLES
jgi:hypothetical protein